MSEAKIIECISDILNETMQPPLEAANKALELANKALEAATSLKDEVSTLRSDFDAMSSDLGGIKKLLQERSADAHQVSIHMTEQADLSRQILDEIYKLNAK